MRSRIAQAREAEAESVRLSQGQIRIRHAQHRPERHRQTIRTGDGRMTFERKGQLISRSAARLWQVFCDKPLGE